MFTHKKNGLDNLERFVMDNNEADSNTVSKVSTNNESNVGQVSSKMESLDLMDAVEIFLRNIRLPEIKSPEMPRYSPEKVFKQGAKILVITEKPKVAQALSKALARGNFKVIRRYGIPMFSLQYKSYFLTIIPLKGHLLEYDTIDKYKSWSSVDPIRIVEDPNALVVKPRYPKLARLLRELAPKHEALIIATDADEEGENIGYEAIKVISEIKRMQVYRMWFLSTQAEELLKAFNNLTKPITNWALAPEARKIIDGFTGFASTRELTLVGRNVSGPAASLLRNSVLSLGRVQSPTLYLLYLRERHIRNFRPKPYWSINAIMMKNEKRFQATHKDSPFYEEAKALAVYRRVNEAREAKVIRVESKIERVRPQPPLDTNKALIMLNKVLGLASDRAMKILEDLYLEGLITYPRTDTDKYPPNYDHARNLRILASDPKFESTIKQILSQGAELKRNGRKLIGDHLPITPIGVPTSGMKLSQQHLQVYELIVRRYLALFLDPAELVHKKVLISVGGEIFQTAGITITREGFWQIYAFNKPRQTFLDLNEGDVLKVHKVQLEQKKTKPPNRLTEAELLKLMEKLGLGTKATRPEHIKKLVTRGYVVRKGRTLLITELGYKIAEFLEKIWPEFLQPYFCAYVLSLLRRIMNGEMNHTEAIEEARRRFLELFLRLRGASKDLKRVLTEVAETELSQGISRRTDRRK